MSATRDAFTADARVIISFPESAATPSEREAFIAFLTAKWLVRQSRSADADGRALADEVDSAWWNCNPCAFSAPSAKHEPAD